MKSFVLKLPKRKERFKVFYPFSTFYNYDEIKVRRLVKDVVKDFISVFEDELPMYCSMLYRDGWSLLLIQSSLNQFSIEVSLPFDFYNLALNEV